MKHLSENTPKILGDLLSTSEGGLPGMPLKSLEVLFLCLYLSGGSVVKNPPANAGDQGQEDPLE